MKHLVFKFLVSLMIASLLLSPAQHRAQAATLLLFERTLVLDGVNDYAVAADDGSLDIGTDNNDDFTLEMFFYVPDLTNNTIDTLIYKKQAYELYIIYSTTVPDRLLFRIYTGSANNNVSIAFDSNLAVGWHHVAGTFNNEFTTTNDAMSLYLDGSLVATASNFELTPGLPDSPYDLTLGGNETTNPAVGSMEEVRISNNVRYSGSSYPVPSVPFASDANTRALWHFDESLNATTFSDSSGNKNTLDGIKGAHVGNPYPPTSATVRVLIPGMAAATYDVPFDTSLRKSYAGVSNGPVQVVSTNGIPIVASERVAYYDGSNWTSHSELMGLPLNQLTTSYIFPWYNNVDLNTQLRFANVGNTTTTITVTIGGAVQGTYNLAPNANQRVSYPGLNAGPVTVTSSGGILIIASMRVAYYNGSAWTDFSEMMGLPVAKLTTSYLFPWYNNTDLNTQLRFANVGSTNTTITVTIGGVVQGTYNLAPNASQRVSYPGLNAGPVNVTSSGNVKIIASERVAYFDGATWTSFSEMMGLPAASLSTSYIFPLYNNVDLNEQLRFANVGTANTIVTVTIGGVLKGTYNLAPSESQRVSFPVNDGPVVIQSSGGVRIIASERVAYFDGSAWTSFAEMMGLPGEQLTTAYVFPWYNNVDINTQLRFGAP